MPHFTETALAVVPIERPENPEWVEGALAQPNASVQHISEAIYGERGDIYNFDGEFCALVDDTIRKMSEEGLLGPPEPGTGVRPNLTFMRTLPHGDVDLHLTHAADITAERVIELLHAQLPDSAAHIVVQKEKSFKSH